ncbi:hypothetical protein NECID01_1861 [Nematocida sp. AWRm77]|nr:hypothetical protein NECID01_1861 [Nematocida sp. AWRm77]
MPGVVTQIVVGSPPSVLSPLVEIKVSGKTCTFNEDSLTPKQKKAIISDGRFWLVFTGEIIVSDTVEISIYTEKKEMCCVTVTKPDVGITRLFKNNFSGAVQNLSNELFLDLIVEDVPEKPESICAFPAPKLAGVPPPPAKAAPPPPFRMSSSVPKQAYKQDPELLSAFPKFAWATLSLVPGSIYGTKDLFLKSTQWAEIESRFKTCFCISRKTSAALLEEPAEKPVEKPLSLLSGRQEFLLSIVFEAMRKKGFALGLVAKEATFWVQSSTPIAHMEEISTITQVLPSEQICELMFAAAPERLSSTELLLKEMLSSTRVRTFLSFISYAHWAEPGLATISKTLGELLAGFQCAFADKNLSVLLVAGLYLGNAVNIKYSDRMSPLHMSHALSLSSLFSFARCMPRKSLLGADAAHASESLLEFLIVSVREMVDFPKLFSAYGFLQTMHLGALSEHFSLIKTGLNEVRTAKHFADVEHKSKNISALIDSISADFLRINEKTRTLAQKYAEPSESFVQNLSSVLDLLGKHSHLFV